MWPTQILAVGVNLLLKPIISYSSFHILFARSLIIVLNILFCNTREGESSNNYISPSAHQMNPVVYFLLLHPVTSNTALHARLSSLIERAVGATRIRNMYEENTVPFAVDMQTLGGYDIIVDTKLIGGDGTKTHRVGTRYWV